MTITIVDNGNDLQANLKNIEQYNYIDFSEQQWEKVAYKLSKIFSKEYNRLPFKIEYEPTKYNPLVKMYFANKHTVSSYLCIKLTPFEVMVGNDTERFKYNRSLTHRWQDILLNSFGESYENAKNRHYGINLGLK